VQNYWTRWRWVTSGARPIQPRGCVLPTLHLTLDGAAAGHNRMRFGVFNGTRTNRHGNLMCDTVLFEGG
jgi:hypothetical protein